MDDQMMIVQVSISGAVLMICLTTAEEPVASYLTHRCDVKDRHPPRSVCNVCVQCESENSPLFILL